MSLTMTALKTTPLHALHVALKARMVPFAGYDMPVQYAGLVEEHKAVRNACGVFDVSHMGQLHISGEKALGLINQLVTNDVSTLVAGKAFYTVACNQNAGILDDLIVYRRGDWDFTVVCNASNRLKIAKLFGDACRDVCGFEDVTEGRALIAIQGPHAADVMRKLNDGERSTTLKSFECVETHIEGFSVFVARTGYTGEDGFEVSTRAEDAASFWSALLEKGKAWGIQPAGLGARDTLRLEAALSLYGNEIDETTNPIEANLGWVVKMNKFSFVGKEAIAKIQSQPLLRKLVGIEMVGRGIARHGYPVVNEIGQSIGIVTSGSPSPTLGKNIGLAYVPTDLAQPGSSVWINIRDQKIEARVVPTPFYKRSKR